MANEPKNDQIANKWLYLLMLIMLVAGAANTILSKLQIEIRDSHGNKFKHPYISTFVTFFAGSMGNIFYFVYIRSRLSEHK